MAGANPSAFGGIGFPKSQKLDRAGEIVDPKMFGTIFQRREVFPIETVNPVLGFTFLGAVGTSPTAFQAGMVGMDWLMTSTTASPVQGPAAVSMEFWVQGKGRDLPVGEFTKLLYNFAASSGGFDYYYDPTNNQFTAQDWIINFENNDPVNVKQINFGAGFTPNVLIIPALTVVQVRFELTAIGQIRILPFITSGSAMGLGNPGGSFNPGPPIQGHDVLVWDSTTNTWQPSGLSTSMRNGRFPGLLIGAPGVVYGPTDLYVEVVRGNPPFGISESILTGNITSGQDFDVFTADAANQGSPATNFGNRGFRDATYCSKIVTAAPDPVDPNKQGPGSYHFIGYRGNPGPLVSNFLITANGEITQFAPLTTAAVSALSVSAAGGLTQGVSRAEFKENISPFSRADSDHYFNALHPVNYDFIGLPSVPRLGFVVQDAEANLGPQDNRIFSFLPGNKIDLSYRSDFDNRSLIALLVEQVQSLKARVTALEAHHQ